MVIPLSFSSGALSISSKLRTSVPCISDNTFVIAAVKVVFPWSTWPIVPMLQCGLFLTNFSVDLTYIPPISFFNNFIFLERGKGLEP
jgi:hypothetical protein